MYELYASAFASVFVENCFENATVSGYIVESVSRQHNSDDCGVFTLAYAGMRGYVICIVVCRFMFLVSRHHYI